MIDRRPFVQKILKNRKDNLRVVSGIGTSTWDIMSAGDNKGNFGFIGAMGQSIPFALGLAKSQPDLRILCINQVTSIVFGSTVSDRFCFRITDTANRLGLSDHALGLKLRQKVAYQQLDRFLVSSSVAVVATAHHHH